MELGQDGQHGLYIFTDIRSVPVIQTNIGRWLINYTAKYLTAEGSVLQHFRAMDRETNSIDPLIFQGVAKV